MAITHVQLKNGSSVARALVISTMMSLESLMMTLPGSLAVCELHSACKDDGYVVDEEFAELLLAYCLLEKILPDYHVNVHDVTRDIVLSAVEGEGMQLRLVSPIAA